MTTIKTSQMEIKRVKHDIVSAKFAMEEIQIKFGDGTFLAIPWHDLSESNKLNMLMQMFRNATAKNIILDLTDPKQMLKIE